MCHECVRMQEKLSRRTGELRFKNFPGGHASDTPRKTRAFGARSNPRAFELAWIRRSIKSPASLSVQLDIYELIVLDRTVRDLVRLTRYFLKEIIDLLLGQYCVPLLLYVKEIHKKERKMFQNKQTL